MLQFWFEGLAGRHKETPTKKARIPLAGDLTDEHLNERIILERSLCTSHRTHPVLTTQLHLRSAAPQTSN